MSARRRCCSVFGRLVRGFYFNLITGNHPTLVSRTFCDWFSEAPSANAHTQTTINRRRESRERRKRNYSYPYLTFPPPRLLSSLSSSFSLGQQSNNSHGLMFASGARATNEQEEEGGKEEDKMEGKQMSATANIEATNRMSSRGSHRRLAWNAVDSSIDEISSS